MVFETFSANIGSSSNITTLNDETLITQVRGDANYKIITFSHDYQTTHSKAYIQFSFNGQVGEITFQISYYGSSYNNSLLNFLFYSLVVAGKQGTAFNHALFDVDDVQLKKQILYFEDVNLNENKIKGLAAPSEDKDGANKKYVDDKIKAIPAVDTSDLLKLNGSGAMTGNLQMGDHTITGRGDLKRLINEVASESLSRTDNGDKMEVNLNMNNNKINNLADPITGTDALNRKFGNRKYLKVDGSNEMKGNLDMNSSSIINLKDPLPSNSHYAATINFVNKTVSDNNATISTLIDSKINEVEDLNIKCAKQENVFSFVMDDDLFKEDDSDISKVGKVNKDFYDIDKETYQFNISYDGNIGYYSTRLGIDLKPLDLGEYT